MYCTCIAALPGVPTDDKGLVSEAPGPRGVETESTEFSAPPRTSPRRDDRLLSLQGGEVSQRWKYGGDLNLVVWQLGIVKRVRERVASSQGQVCLVATYGDI